MKVNGILTDSISKIGNVSKANITSINGNKFVNIITDGLKFYVDPFNSRSYPGTGNTYYDLSPSQYNFTINGPTFNSGSIKYFSFDGVNDYMHGPSGSTPFNDIPTSGYTYSMWIYFPSAPDYLDANFSVALVLNDIEYPFWYDHRTNDGGSVASGAGHSFLTAGNNAATQAVTTYAETVPTGSWNLYTFRFQYATTTTCTMSIWRNSTTLVTENNTRTGTGTWANYSSDRKRYIGAADVYGTITRYSQARYGQIMYYNRSLSSTEITRNYDNTKKYYGL
jgi:hypothetical protein